MESRLPKGLMRGYKKHIYDNNNHSEGVIGIVKRQPDKKANGEELALYSIRGGRIISASAIMRQI